MSNIKKLYTSLSLYYFFFFSYVGVFIIYMPKILHDRGYSADEIGILYSIIPIVRFIAPFLFLKYIKITKSISILSNLFFILSAFLFLMFIDSFWALFFINILIGASIAITLPTIENIALLYVKKERYGKVRLFGSLGFSLVALLLAPVLENFTYVALFYSVNITLSAIMAIYILDFNKESKRNKNVESKEEPKLFNLKSNRWIWVNLILLQVSFGSFYNFFTIYEEKAGISLEVISYMWVFGVMCEVVMLYYQGGLLKKYDLLWLIMLSTLATAIRWMLLFLFPDSITIVFISQSIHALSFALYHSAAISYLYKVYDGNHLAQQFYVGFSYGLGMFIGSIFAGFTFGDNLFLYSSLIAMLAFVSLLLHKKETNLSSIKIN